MIVNVAQTPDIKITNSMHNIARLIEEEFPGWCVNYTCTLVPRGELRDFFLEADAYTRATFSIQKYGLELFAHIDFKDTTEIYVIQRIDTKIVVRRLYTVANTDSINLLHVLTTELTGFLNGHEQQAGR